MWRCCSVAWLVMAGLVLPGLASDRIEGTYVEARTCQIYTGPCFANGEVGSAGKDAMMAWKISQGTYGGADLAGETVVMVVKASETLGFNGFQDAKRTKAVVYVSATADVEKAKALRAMALQLTGLKEQQLADVQTARIAMDFDLGELTASVEVDNVAHVAVRKARPNDCICSNESAYYPPLTRLKGFVPGVTMLGDVTARKLGTRWSIPDTRTAYLGTFEVDTAPVHLVKQDE